MVNSKITDLRARGSSTFSCSCCFSFIFERNAGGIWPLGPPGKKGAAWPHGGRVTFV